MDGPSQVLLLHGFGGMGKSELCRRFEAIAHGKVSDTAHNRHRFVVVTVNWQEERENHVSITPSGMSIGPRELFTVLYDAIASDNDLNASGKLRRRATRAFDEYRRVVAHLPDVDLRADVPDDALSAVGSGLQIAGKMGDAVTGLPVSTATDGLGRMARAARANRSQLGPNEISSALRPEESLSRAFARGLREVSEARPVVVILDTYEIVAGCGAWIRQVMRSSGGRVLWVAAGRLEPENEAGSSGELAAFRREIPEDRLRVIAMTHFGRETIAEELTQRGVRGDDEVSTLDAVAALTRGVPLAVGIVAGMLAQGETLEEVAKAVTAKGDTPKLVRELTERYLLHALGDASLREDIPLLYGLSLLYTDQSDPEILAALWDCGDDVARVQDDLAQRHDFVLTGSRRLHQEVRDTFRLYLLDGSRRASLREANQRAAQIALLRARSHVGSGSSEKRVASDQWRAAVATLVWHRLWESNDRGLEILVEVLPEAILMHRGFANELLGLATFFEETFTPEQSALLEALTSLLSLGSFLDDWLARRRDWLLGGTLEPPLAHAEDADTSVRERAVEALRAHTDQQTLLPAQPPRKAVVDLLIAASNAKVDPAQALGDLESATGDIPVGDGPLAAVVGRTAGQITQGLGQPKGNEKPSTDAAKSALLKVRYEPDSPIAWLGLGRVYSILGQSSDAIGAFDEMLERFGADRAATTRRFVAEALLAKGVTLHNVTKLDDAIEVYDEMAVRFEDDDDRQIRRLVAKALVYKVRALGSDSRTSGDYLAALGEVVSRFGGDADPELRGVVGEALFNQGNRLWDRGDAVAAVSAYDGALEHLDDATSLDHRRLVYKALVNKALCLRDDGVEEAVVVQAYDEVIDRFTGEDLDEFRDLVARARLQKTWILWEADPTALSEDELEAIDDEVRKVVTELERPSAILVGAFGLFLADIKEDQAGARQAYEQAVELDPENANNLGNFARLLFEDGEIVRASEITERARKFASDSQDALDLELDFYVISLGSADLFDHTLDQIRDLVGRGSSSPGWRFDRILARAAEEGREDIEWLRLLAEVINGDRSPEVLDGWSAWQEAERLT